MADHAYSAVPTSEGAAAEGRRRRRQRQDVIEAISNKIHAMLWVFGSALTLYLTDLGSVVLSDPRVSW